VVVVCYTSYMKARAHEYLIPLLFGTSLLLALLKSLEVIMWSWWLVATPVMLLVVGGGGLFVYFSATVSKHEKTPNRR